MIAGLDYTTGDCAIFMDADLQDPPELIPELVKYWEEGYDDIYAKRRSREGETFLKKFTSKMYYKVLQKMTRIEIPTEEQLEARRKEMAEPGYDAMAEVNKAMQAYEESKAELERRRNASRLQMD